MTAALRYLALLALPLALSACDQLGIETPAVKAAQQEAEGKAIGGACRHAGRALEDCYANNKKASKAAVYTGWREMDGYMRENKIEVVAPAKDEAPAAEKPAAEVTEKADKAKDEGQADAKKAAREPKEGKEPAGKPAHKTSALKPGTIEA